MHDIRHFNCSYLVDWVATICERCDITSETLHLAIMCLDHFMDKYSIEDAQLHLIALCCLLIAGTNTTTDTFCLLIAGAVVKLHLLYVLNLLQKI